eukprot:6304927-Prymnesium_polylepis.1
MVCRIVLSAAQRAMASDGPARSHPSPTELPRMWHATRRPKASMERHIRMRRVASMHGGTVAAP